MVLSGIGGVTGAEFGIDESARFEGWFGGPVSKWHTARIEGDSAIPSSLEFEVEVISETDTDVKVSVDLGSIVCEVRVRTSEGVPVSDATVQLLRQNSPRNISGRTGIDGVAKLSFLAAGSYSLLARHAEMGQSPMQPVELRSDQRVDVRLDGYLESTVEVRTVAGAPVPFADVFIYRATDGPYAQSRTDGSGSAKLRFAPDGLPVVLTVLSPTYGAWSSCAPAKASLRVNMALGPLGVIDLGSNADLGPRLLTTPDGGVLFGNALAQWWSRTKPAHPDIVKNLPPGSYGLSRDVLGYGNVVRAVCAGQFKPDVSGFLYPEMELRLVIAPKKP